MCEFSAAETMSPDNERLVSTVSSVNEKGNRSGRFYRPLGLLLAVCLIFSFPSTSFASSDDAERQADALLAKARQAVGGKAWEGLQTVHIISTEVYGKDGSRKVEYKADLQTGRFVKTRGSPALWGEGWDGKEVWGLESGKSYADDMSKEAWSEAYRRCFGYWFDRCRGAQKRVVDHREYGQATYSVVRIEPEGATPFEYWIKEKSARIERMQTFDAWGRPLAMVDYSDFRAAGKAMLPFKAHYFYNDGRADVTSTIDNVTWNEKMDGTVFAKRRGNEIEGFTKSSAGTSVPFQWIDNHIFIEAQINRVGPFRLIFDSGAGNILTRDAVQRLGLKVDGVGNISGFKTDFVPIGKAQASKLTVVGLSLSDQVFAVSDFGKEVLRHDGILGDEWLEHCVVEINYAESRLTFYDPDRFAYQGEAKPVPLIYPKQGPRIVALVDGVVGSFGVDTGDGNGLSVSRRFSMKLPPDAEPAKQNQDIASSGIDGKFVLHLRRGKSLQIGDAVLLQPTIDVAGFQAGGALGDPGVDGKIGNDILKNFRVTFDFPHNMAYFEKNDASQASGSAPSH